MGEGWVGWWVSRESSACAKSIRLEAELFGTPRLGKLWTRRDRSGRRGRSSSHVPVSRWEQPRAGSRKAGTRWTRRCRGREVDQVLLQQGSLPSSAESTLFSFLALTLVCSNMSPSRLRLSVPPDPKHPRSLQASDEGASSCHGRPDFARNVQPGSRLWRRWDDAARIRNAAAGIWAGCWVPALLD